MPINGITHLPGILHKILIKNHRIKLNLVTTPNLYFERDIIRKAGQLNITNDNLNLPFNIKID